MNSSCGAQCDSVGYFYFLKVGLGERYDLEAAAAVRAVIGEASLRLDANDAWDVATAIRRSGSSSSSSQISSSSRRRADRSRLSRPRPLVRAGAHRRRFRPRSLGPFLGLVPSEDSSGERRHQGAITKTGNTHARRLLVEAAGTRPPAAREQRA